MAVTIDIVDGAGGRKTKDGWELTRIATVNGVTGTGHARVIAAVTAVIVITGDIGSSHPSHTSAKLQEFQPDAVSSDAVKVRVVYKDQPATDDPDYAEIEVGSSLSQVESNKDYDDNLITVQYTYPATYKQDDKKRGQTITQGGLVTRDVPESTIVYSRLESSSPGAKSRTYSGTVNSGGWSLDPTAPARTWKCLSITGRSSDGGSTWRVTYTFGYREDTWDQTVLFINPDDGKPPPDLVDGTGIKTVQVYTEADFDNLGL